MSTQRQWVSATVLPDGRVLGTGGSAVENQLIGVNNSRRDLESGHGHVDAGRPGVNARLYHSIAAAAARRLGAGRRAAARPARWSTSTPRSTTRRICSTPPARARRGRDHLGAGHRAPGRPLQGRLPGAGSVSRVSFIKTGSTTHSYNMDQRYLQLPFTANGNLLDVQLPSRAGDVPPGYYMLFVLNAQGVPSVARMVRVGITTADPTPGPISRRRPAARAARRSRSPAKPTKCSSACAAPRPPTCNQVAPQCVRVNPTGQWIGTPVERGITGTAGATNYTKTCPANPAISGFRGRFSAVRRPARFRMPAADVERQARRAPARSSAPSARPPARRRAPGAATRTTRCSPFTAAREAGSTASACSAVRRRRPFVNTPPTLANPGNQSTPVGSAVDLPISASDVDGNTLTFSAIGLPPGLTVNAATGSITGAPTTAGNYSVGSQCLRRNGHASVTFAWTVTNTPPFTLDPLPPATPKVAGTPVTLHGDDSQRQQRDLQLVLR